MDSGCHFGIDFQNFGEHLKIKKSATVQQFQWFLVYQKLSFCMSLLMVLSCFFKTLQEKTLRISWRWFVLQLVILKPFPIFTKSQNPSKPTFLVFPVTVFDETRHNRCAIHARPFSKHRFILLWHFCQAKHVQQFATIWFYSVCQIGKKQTLNNNFRVVVCSLRYQCLESKRLPVIKYPRPCRARPIGQIPANPARKQAKYVFPWKLGNMGFW